jgi:deazaflavin-dependent oxidoreductase (nitroreductase family)
MRVTATGRKSGQPRSVILGYVEDGDDLVTLAMNGWANPEPAWWLNLQVNPEATVELVGGERRVRARAAAGEERDRLWARWRDYEPKLDEHAALRDGETAVVVLEPVRDTTRRRPSRRRTAASAKHGW